MGSFNKLKKLLEEKESFLLVCHVEPDGDAVGSMLGLAEALKGQEKEVLSVCKDKMPPIFEYLKGTTDIQDKIGEKGFQAVILLDNGDFKRTGLVDEIKEAQRNGIPVLNIDHHPKNDLWKYADINYANAESSSTSELVYKILVGLDYDITPMIATCLLTGIFYDTGGFKHPNTSEAVLSIAADLLRRGARLRKISDNIANSKTMPVFKLWGIALSRLKIHPTLGISVSVLSQKDLIDCSATEDDVSGLVNLLSSAPESKAALLLYETKDAKIKGSLRTERDNIDLAKLAQLLGGGGHKKASGFTIPGKLKIDDGHWEII
jgi:phosphoesterase RecJ-like protein